MPSKPAGTKVAFLAGSEEADRAARRLTRLYAGVEPDQADIIVALGGDGHMLQMLHRFMSSGKPIYGMNQGSVGFLMNEYQEDDLIARLTAAETSEVRPLVMDVIDADGHRQSAFAINEVSMIRQSYQAAKLRIAIDGQVRLEELICDGILVATPAGSTAYNLSAHGPILPINAPLLAITPISAFRPRRWRGALVPDRVEITIEVLEAAKRPVNAVADHTEVKSVSRVTVKQDPKVKSLIMFDPDHGWDERVLTEQFLY